jgi:hypothetical protein
MLTLALKNNYMDNYHVTRYCHLTTTKKREKLVLPEIVVH